LYGKKIQFSHETGIFLIKLIDLIIKIREYLVYINKKEFNVNKNDLIASVASSAGLSKSDATRAIESLLDAVTNSLKRDEKVSIVGFGNFSVSHRKATTGRNPRTGESIQIPASKRPKFTVGKALKDAVNI
jgi:DNA-binding protein HU-beta